MLQSPEYGLDLSFGTFTKTLQSYSHHIYKSVPVLVVSIILIIAFGIVKKDKLVIFFISSSMGFYIPYSFAIFQRNVNYLAISFLLYCISILIILRKHIRLPVLILLFLLYNVINTRTLLKEYSENPAGDRLKTFIAQMKDVYINKELYKYGKIYFKTDEEVTYKTGIAAIDMKDVPIFWLRLVDGKALKIFLDSKLEYHAVSYNKEAPEGFPVMIVSKDLYRREDAGLKQVIMPRK
jgi:hypothetical protein